MNATRVLFTTAGRPPARLAKARLLPQQLFKRRVSSGSAYMPGTVSPRLTVPDGIVRPSYADSGVPDEMEHYIALQPPDAIASIRSAGRLAREMLDLACSLAKPGITPDEIDARVHAAIVEAGAYPAPLNYRGFPKSICAAPNEVICHGIPDDRPLVDGDIVSFDVSLYIGGVFGDNCATVPVGAVDAAGLKLIEV